MTTVTAVKKGKRLCIASDSLTVFGTRREVAGKHVYDEGKILQIGQNYVGMAGHPSWNLILNLYFSKQKEQPEWETTDQIFEIFNIFHRHLKDFYYLSPSYSRYEPFESSEFCLLVINSHGIFEIDYLRMVRHYSRFSAIGTGEEYALGAMQALYDGSEDPEEIAKIGIEAASQFDKKTELPSHVMVHDDPSCS